MVKKAISLKDSIYKFALEKTERLFSGNFSGYVGYLISKDMQDDKNIKAIENSEMKPNIRNLTEKK